LEDPSLRVRTDTETGQMILSGMGELHLEIIVDRMLREFKVDANVGKPQVAYKETISSTQKVEIEFLRPISGKDQFGHCVIEFSPAARGDGMIFENAVPPEILQKKFVDAVKNGLLEAAYSGPLGGYPVVDFKAKLVSSKFSETNSTELAYKIAASMALREGATKASPVLLEPIMNCEVTCPENYMGDVIGDLNSRRGKILSMSLKGTAQIIKAQLPLAAMFGYSTTLRSLSQGRASYSMEPSHYEAVPPQVAREVLKSFGYA
jgi:elongation factor G